jgi:hypothetical protein
MLQVNIDAIDDTGISTLGTVSVYSIPRQGDDIQVMFSKTMITGKVLNVEHFAYSETFAPGPAIAALLTIETKQEVKL